MNTINWTIQAIHCVEEGVVDTITTRVSYGTFNQDVNVYIGTKNDDSFIEYSSLPEATVMGWVRTCLGSTYMDNVEASIIAKANAPTINETPLPWV
jgi:hypothetical protein